MKKYEILAIVIVVLYVISMFSSPLHAWLVSRIYSPEDYGILSIHQRALLSVQWFLKGLVAIAIAVWLGYQAQKDGHSVPVWVLFGLFFSVLGAILYFVLRSQPDRSAQSSELLSP